MKYRIDSRVDSPEKMHRDAAILRKAFTNPKTPPPNAFAEALRQAMLADADNLDRLADEKAARLAAEAAEAAEAAKGSADNDDDKDRPAE